MDRGDVAKMRMKRNAPQSRQARGRETRGERDLSIAGFILGAGLALAWMFGLFFGKGAF